MQSAYVQCTTICKIYVMNAISNGAFINTWQLAQHHIHYHLNVSLLCDRESPFWRSDISCQTLSISHQTEHRLHDGQ